MLIAQKICRSGTPRIFKTLSEKFLLVTTRHLHSSAFICVHLCASVVSNVTSTFLNESPKNFNHYSSFKRSRDNSGNIDQASGCNRSGSDCRRWGRSEERFSRNAE